ncbi:oligosaccharide flippase family protein [Pseudomonas asiatica]|uniref:oligosaccharide flippase family protein n=2 Tax=Pseudomonas TaxID=286 RepID=UPI0025579A24|nr:oligosaccharide flippase family protein [Pseudomonas sp. M2(2023)]MDY4312229.1 oligosaccharide flippase family protein [Pseudomonas putida]MDY4322126.1 oligosaccharide flippase family protein [Pseudomonas putida]WIV25294.1 oligosaccharide flippase family protein [Pseudomonas sp. M2(2023)]
MNFVQVRALYKNNLKVISNYLHMTMLQVLNSFFYLLIYPYVIHCLGVEGFGLYVFASGIAMYFMVFVNFGFDIHAAKLVSLEQDNQAAHAGLMARVLIAKCWLACAGTIVFLVLMSFFEFMQTHWLVFSLAYANVLSSVFLPLWYFHGMQRMKVLTIIQLALKVLSLPLIFLLVTQAADLVVYTAIVVGVNVLASLVAFAFAVRACGSLALPVYQDVKALLLDVQPFFWSTAANTFKQKSIEVIIGSLFGMKEVAIYDLANKIFSVPSLLASNINAALFPALIRNAQRELISKIIKIELGVGLLCILSVVLAGYWVVELIAPPGMEQAYYLSVLLSFSILTYLIVGSHIYFIYVPNQCYGLVLKNQIVSIISFYVFCALYLSVNWDISSVVLGLVSSAMLEIVYSYRLVKKVPEYQ